MYFLLRLLFSFFHFGCGFVYFENHQQVIGTSIIGLGTDEDSLTRAIISREEMDMMKVRGEYINIYKSNLDDAVVGDTSGDYRRFLVTLLGGKI